MVGDKPCEFEAFVRFLAENGLEGDSCRQLDQLVADGKAREVKDHLSSWVKMCAQQLVDVVEEQRALASDLMQLQDPEDPTDWVGRRSDIEKFLYEGWRQHWLQLWGYAGQQYLADERFDVLADALNYSLGHTRKGKALRKRLDALRTRKG